MFINRPPLHHVLLGLVTSIGYCASEYTCRRRSDTQLHVADGLMTTRRTVIDVADPRQHLWFSLAVPHHLADPDAFNVRLRSCRAWSS